MKTSSTLGAAPHRLMFLAGTTQALLAMGFWTSVMGARAGLWSATAWPLFAVLPPAWWHAEVMLAGVLGFFICGFILTAGPRWQGQGDLPPSGYLPAFCLMAGGALGTWLALVLPWLLAPSLFLSSLGLAVVAITLAGVARRPASGHEHIVYASLALALGAAGLALLAAFALGLFNAGAQAARLGIGLLLWGFVLPVFLVVTHRMLPFFTGSALTGYVARRPFWALRLLLIASLGHGALDGLGLIAWRGWADLSAALVAFYLSGRWWDARVPGQRMLLVLHWAFAWVGLAFSLFAIESVTWAAHPGLFGLAPLHALTLGYCSAMLVGMASRVVLGHSGRPIVAEGPMWWAFWLMQVTALLRVGGDLLAMPLLFWLASGGWLLAFGRWAWHYAPYLWQPRRDGRPG